MPKRCRASLCAFVCASLLALAFSPGLHAQQYAANLSTQASGCGNPGTASTAYLVVAVPANSGAVGFAISGTWSGTVSFFATVNSGATWSALGVNTPGATGSQVTTASANGNWTASPSPYSHVCAVFTTASSGTAALTIAFGQPSATLRKKQGGSIFQSLLFSPSDSSIVASWTTSASSNSNITCGGKTGVDNGLAPNSTTHQAIVTGLSASTGYSCTVTSGANTSTPQNVSTLTAAVRTPIGSAAFGSSVVSAPTGNGGDYPTNFVSSDGNTYIGMDDGYGFAASMNAGANMQIGTINPATMVGTNVNALTGYGGFNTFNGTDCSNPASGSMTNKEQGLFGLAGNLYLFALRICNEASLTAPVLTYGNVIMSANHGVSWNNYTATGTFNANGNPPAQGSFQFANANIGSVNPVRYAADDGTLGYLTAGNRIDGGDAYVYMAYKLTADISNEYLMRQPRILFEEQATTGITYWTGPGSPTPANFVNDSNWSASAAGATAIYSTSSANAYIGDITFIPGLNGYLFLNTYRPTGGGNFSVFNFFSGPTPAGPWTEITELTNVPTGFYSPSVLHSSVLGNSATSNVPINFLHSGIGGVAYYFQNQGLTLNPNTLTTKQLVWYGCNTNENPISDGGNFTALSGFSALQATPGDLCETSIANPPSSAITAYTAPPVAGDTGAPWPADQCSEIYLISVNATGYAELGVRLSTSGTGYLAIVNGAGSGTLYSVASSTMFTSIGTITAAAVSGDTWRLCASGTTLTVTENGTSRGSFTDSTYSSGFPGFGLYNTVATTDSQLWLWNALANQAAAPAFSSVTTAGSITLTSATGSATIYYTTSGSQPTRSSSNIASGSAVTVTAGQKLCAMTAASDYADSNPVCVQF